MGGIGKTVSVGIEMMLEDNREEFLKEKGLL